MHTQFYRDRLRRLFDGGDGVNGRFRFDRWSETPIFGRAEAQVAGSTLFAAQTPPDVGEARVGSTSGSTGRPLDYRVSALVDISANATFTRCLENSGCDLSGTLGYIKSDIANDCQPPLGSSGSGLESSGRGRALVRDCREFVDRRTRRMAEMAAAERADELPLDRIVDHFPDSTRRGRAPRDRNRGVARRKFTGWICRERA